MTTLFDLLCSIQILTYVDFF